MENGERARGLFQRMLGRSAPADDDAADYGTCIGLEYALDQRDAAPTAADAEPRRGWLQRLSGGARTA